LGKVNILWYQSLRASAYLAREVVGNHTLADEYDEWADKVHTSVNNQLYDKVNKFYYISTDRKTGVAQDLNSMAILYGVAPMEDRQAILDTMSAALVDESKPGKYLAYSYDAYGYPHKAVPYSAVSVFELRHIVSILIWLRHHSVLPCRCRLRGLQHQPWNGSHQHRLDSCKS
jgi:hypothetical protein